MSHYTRRVFLSVLVAAACTLVSLRAQQTVTLETLLAAPFPSEIVAAPAGGHVAWVENAKGSRNVWVASAPDFAPRQLTSYAGDDGQDITGLTWTRDGRTMLYVRGGGANRQGEIPNPAITPQPAEQAIWAVDASRRPPRRASSRTAAARRCRPAGRSSTSHAVRCGRPTSPATAKPAQLFTIRGSAGSLRWSPDGSRLAFVSGRGDHSFIGVYDIARRSRCAISTRASISTAIPPGRPTARASCSRASRRPARPSCSRRGAKACPGRSVSSRSPPARRRKSGRRRRAPGSVFQGVTAPEQLMWAAGDRIVFPVGTRRLDSPLLVPVGGRQADAAHARRVRGRARHDDAGPAPRRLQLQSGRHRSPAPLVGRRRWQRRARSR